MQSLSGKIRQTINSLKNVDFKNRRFGMTEIAPTYNGNKAIGSKAPSYGSLSLGLTQSPSKVFTLPTRSITTMGSASQKASTSSDVSQRIKFKRLDKTARHIMQILDKEAVEEVKEKREIPDIRPGYIVQLKLEVPENKRRVVSVIKGIVIGL